MRKIIMLFFGILLYSCKTGDTFWTIDTDMQYDKIVLNFDDYINDCKIIQLETNDSCLLSTPKEIIKGDDFLIITSLRNAYKFSLDGLFLGKILREGRGPGEIDRIADCAVNNKEKILICVQMDNSSQLNIYTYDGVLLKNIPNAKGLALQEIAMSGDSAIVCFPQISMSAETKSLLFCQDFNGNLIYDIPHTFHVEDAPVLRRKKGTYVSNTDIFYLTNNSDTLYKVSNRIKHPQLDIKNRKIEKDEMVFNDVLFLPPKILILRHKLCKLQNIGGGNISMVPVEKKYFLIDLKDNKARQIAGCTSSKMGLSCTDRSQSYFLDNLVSLKNGDIANILNYSDLSYLFQNDCISNQKLTGIYQTMTDNSNPAIYITSLK